jgi:subtilisin family serine protease
VGIIRSSIMPTVHFGTKQQPAFELKQSDDLIAVRTRSRRSLRRGAAPVAEPFVGELDDGTLVVAFPDAGVEVYRVDVGTRSRSLTVRKAALRKAPDVRFAGGVLIDPTTKESVLYTENIFIKFFDTIDPDECRAIIANAGLTIKDTLDFAVNAYFLEAPEGTGQDIFAIANTLLLRSEVEYCHPELVRERKRKAIAAQQWHLKRTTIGGVQIDAHANVDAAHATTRGDGITIAIIDDGIDIEHPDFAGAGKIVAPRDATGRSDNPRPKDSFGTGPENGDNHGTACASGVAPNARLMPIRLASGLGSVREAEAFRWAADNGADVISCSWGPTDGRWWDANDARHNAVVPIPASTKLAIDYAIANGRGGKGCVILFAAGNGNESVDNDGYASNPSVIAVAACNDRSKRSVYSDFGRAVWCAFPSNDFGHAPFDRPDPLTSGIWTTDRRGADGYNIGSSADGDGAGHYTNSFGGTSSACPGAAGVAALVLATNPALRWNEVKDVMKRACDRIDPQGGAYDVNGHSKQYGYGRLNARTAVELAKPQPQNAVSIRRVFDAPIPDLQTVRFALDVVDDAPIETISATVDLKHSYIGDLIVKLIPPPALGMSAVVLHQRGGGSANALKKAYSASSTPGLAAFAGKRAKGAWTLEIRDAEAQDTGTLVSFTLKLTFAHANRVADAPQGASPRTTAPDRTRRQNASVRPRKTAADKAPKNER